MAAKTNSVSYILIPFPHGLRLTIYIDLFLKNFVAANPAKSAYGFTLNRKRSGHFSLCFLANKNSTVQSWVCNVMYLAVLPVAHFPLKPVRVTPEAYYLFDTPAPGVPELCDVFQVRHIRQFQNNGGATTMEPILIPRSHARATHMSDHQVANPAFVKLSFKLSDSSCLPLQRENLKL